MSAPPNGRAWAGHYHFFGEDAVHYWYGGEGKQNFIHTGRRLIHFDEEPTRDNVRAVLAREGVIDVG